MKFTADEKPSNSSLYTIVTLRQYVQRPDLPFAKAYDSKRDWFNHSKSLLKEKALKQIKAPILADFA